jgi:hypothetical protein
VNKSTRSLHRLSLEDAAASDCVGDERCTVAILDFLRTTDVGVRGGKERRLEVGEDDGEDGGAEWTEDEDKEEAQSEAWGEWSEDEGG